MVVAEEGVLYSLAMLAISPGAVVNVLVMVVVLDGEIGFGGSSF